MAKMLKQLVFGPKKNPPAPPRPDYEGNKTPEAQLDCDPPDQYYDHDYENLPKFKHIKGGSKIQFAEKKEPELVVFDNYSEPADLRAEIAALEDDPLYMSPLDDQGCAPPLLTDEDEEEMYCVPYDTNDDGPPVLPHPCYVQGRYPNGTDDDAYDVVPNVSDEEDNDVRSNGPATVDEYDEPWEWTVGARLTSSLQVSPASLSLGHSDPEDSNEDEDMMARQRRLYETAFDSRVRRKDGDDMDGLVQSPLLLGTTVARAASRSSFGSTSGSSASSTPTHQPMEVGRHHFTPTERRRVTLVRDSQPRSMSPQARPKPDLLKGVVNANYERKISLGHWDSVSRCSSSTDKSSSQESMNVEVSSSRNIELSSRNERNCTSIVLRDEGSRNLTSNYPNNWKELSSAKLENSNDAQKNVQNSSCVLQKDSDSLSSGTKKTSAGHSGVKVLPTDNSPRFGKTKFNKTPNNDLSLDNAELKENAVQVTSADTAPHRRPTSGLLSEVRSSDNNVQPLQSPEVDNRSSDDYDPPWDLKMGNVLRPSGVNGSVSVPERLSNSSQGCPQMTTSVTHDKLEVEETKDRLTAPTKLNKPNGLSQRPNLNLNLNLNGGGGKAAMRQKNLTLDFGCSALSAVGEKVDPQVTLEKQGWYHGSISRVDAEGKLRVLKEGSYLVRNSESSKHDYSLSLKSARGFMHMKIVPTSEGRFILGQFSNPFPSIPEMIQHYSVNKLPIKGAEHMSLLYPVIEQLL